jgi:hypothetical protein
MTITETYYALEIEADDAPVFGYLRTVDPSAQCNALGDGDRVSTVFATWSQNYPSAVYFADHAARFLAYNATEATFVGESSGGPLPVSLVQTADEVVTSTARRMIVWNDAGGSCASGIYTPGTPTAEHTKYREDTAGFLRDLEVYFGAPWAGERMLAWYKTRVEVVDGATVADELFWVAEDEYDTYQPERIT